jgi:two-component system, response regulator YesN
LLEEGDLVLRRYLLRLLSFSLILGTIPTVFIGIFSYYYASQDVETKVYESNLQVLTQTQMRVEQLLKSLEMAAIQYVNSAVVKESISVNVADDDFTRVRELTNGLINLETSAVLHQASLINFENDWVVDLSIWKRLSSVEREDEFVQLAKRPNNIFWLASIGPSSNTVRFIHKIPIIPKSTEPKGMLLLEITYEEIQKLLTPENRLGTHYILDGEGNDFLSSELQREANREVNRKIAEVVRSGDEQGYFNSYVGDQEVGVSYRSSSYNGWTYVSMVSVSAITAQTKQIAIVTLTVCAIMLALVLLIALYGSRQIYSPIRRIIEFTKEAVEDIQKPDDKKDELSFIQDSIQSLSATRKSLENQVKGQYDHLKEFFVLKLLTGQMTEEDYLYRSAMYGFPNGWRKLAVLSLQIDNFQDTRYMEHDKELLLFAINNMVGELLSPQTRFSPILLGSNQVTLVAIAEDEHTKAKEHLYHIAERIQQSVGQYLQLRVSIGISSTIDQLSGAVKAYGESLSALKSRIHLGHEIIIHYEDIERKGGEDTAVYSHLRVMEDQLAQALRGGQLDRAEEVLENYLSAVLDKDAYVNEHSMLLLQLVGQMVRLIQEQGIPIKKVMDSEADMEQFLKLQTREEIAHWFHTQLFDPIIQSLTEKAETYYVNIADRLVQMIHERYEQEISLELFATELNFHPVYMSRVFKREIGIPFSDYLSDYRMKMAGMLLETTQLKVSEIGERLQYKNISAFIRSFRKMYGVTPGKYRERFESNG